MDQVFTQQFWQEIVARLPWAIPLLLIGGFIGWKWKAANDSGEIREPRFAKGHLRSSLNSTASKLSGITTEAANSVASFFSGCRSDDGHSASTIYLLDCDCTVASDGALPP
jgi:hypothetical protein